MATKRDLMGWNDGANQYEAGEYAKAITTLKGNGAAQSVAEGVGAKAHFNIGMCYSALGQHDQAIDAFTAAIKLDRFFAVAYFMRGFHQLAKNVPVKAVQDYNNAADFLRGNALIDYTQLGMPFKLYYCEIVHNRAICNKALGYVQDATEDVELAWQARMEKSHDALRSVMPGFKFLPPFSVPKGKVFRPPESKLKAAADKVDYLGASKIVGGTDRDDIVGFKGAQLRRMAQEGSTPNLRPVNPPAPAPERARSSSALASTSTNGAERGRSSSGSAAAAPPSAAAKPGAKSERGPLPVPPTSSRSSAGSAPSSTSGSPKPSSLSSSSAAPAASKSIAAVASKFGGTSTATAASTTATKPAASAASSKSTTTAATTATSTAPVTKTSGAPATKLPAPGEKIKIKCHYKDTRMLLVEPTITYAALVAAVATKFECKPTFRLKYQDEDHDKVLLTDQEDWEMALATCDQGKLDLWAV